jgi:poly(3-hydroxybutyrate) depolymerase
MRLTKSRWLRTLAVVTALAVLTMVGTTLTGSFRGGTAQAADGGGAATSGCGKDPTLTSGDHTIQSKGKNRTYVLDIPQNYDRDHPYRLVFGLHWLGAGQRDVVGTQYYGLKPLSDNSTIFVSPQGLDNGWRNGGGEDVALIDEIIKQVEGDLCVDTTQLFSLGFSYGAAMSYALACERPSVFRAVALYAGGAVSGCNGGNDPIAMFQAHGISDGVLPIAGARAMRDRFLKNNGCTVQDAPDPEAGSRTHVTVDYDGCSEGHPLKWIAFDGGHEFNPADGGNKTYMADETWKFFSQFESSASEPTDSATPVVPTSTTTTPDPTEGTPGTSTATTPGCGKTPTLTSGEHSIQSGGKNRTYVLDVPQNYDRNHAYRLVFGFHWYGGSQRDVAGAQFYGLKPLSDNSTIFVAPQGLNAGWGNANGEDVTFVDDMIKQVEGGFCVDKTQLFTVGFSYGGAMSFRLACERPEVFRAAGVYSGGPISGSCPNSKPIAYLASHGISDIGLSGAAAARDGFVKANGCTPQTPPDPAKGSRTHISTDYAGCSADHPVRWISFDGGHDASPKDGQDSKSYLPDETWEFFTQFQPASDPAPTTATDLLSRQSQ